MTHLSTTHWSTPPLLAGVFFNRSVIDKGLVKDLLVNNFLVCRHIVDKSIIDKGFVKDLLINDFLVNGRIVDGSLVNDLLLHRCFVNESLVGGCLVDTTPLFIILGPFLTKFSSPILYGTNLPIWQHFESHKN
jgi:hypothetical protein